jgi:thymidylate synthase (FAD)
MGQFVKPQVYLIGYTGIEWQAFREYLKDSGNMNFIGSVESAIEQGLHPGEVLCSFYAKLCYASLTLGKNDNVTKIRDIPANLKSCFDSGHGSVFEHTQLNFVVRNCSRVFTHELVRHRVGTAFSQTSGRYVRGETIDLIFDPILEPVREEGEELLRIIEEYYRKMVAKMGLNDKSLDFNKKKKITSALRRFLPNGQSNEIGFSLNLRSLRHTMQMRTSRHSEWEIRYVYSQVYNICVNKFPSIFCDAKVEEVDGLTEVSGMKLQP